MQVPRCLRLTLALVKAATGEAKGGGASLLTSGLTNAGAQVHVEQEKPERLSMSTTSGKRLVELCTFSATARQNGGKTELTVGGLETYKTKQETLLYLIPLGPKAIHGFSLYKRFLGSGGRSAKGARRGSQRYGRRARVIGLPHMENVLGIAIAVFFFAGVLYLRFGAYATRRYKRNKENK